jgi:hypothetical protein
MPDSATLLDQSIARLRAAHPARSPAWVRWQRYGLPIVFLVVGTILAVETPPPPPGFLPEAAPLYVMVIVAAVAGGAPAGFVAAAGAALIIAGSGR